MEKTDKLYAFISRFGVVAMGISSDKIYPMVFSTLDLATAISPHIRESFSGQGEPVHLAEYCFNKVIENVVTGKEPKSESVESVNITNAHNTHLN